MADSSVPITPGSGADIDTRTEADNSQHRQVIVIGDQSVTEALADVKHVDPGSADGGLVVRDVNTSAIVSSLAGTIGVFFDRGEPTVKAKPSQTGELLQDVTLRTVHVTNVGTSAKLLASEGTIIGDLNRVRSVVSGTMNVRPNQEGESLEIETVRVLHVTDVGTSAKLLASEGTIIGDLNRVRSVIDGTMKVYPRQTGELLQDVTLRTVHVTNVGTSAKLLASEGTIIGDLNRVRSIVDGTISIANIQSTVIIPRTVSGTVTTAGGSGANTLKAPVTSRNIKVYAYSLTTTAQVPISPRFTNGTTAGSGEFWRVALQAPAQGIAGANLAVMPPGYLFAAGTGNTLALFLDSASLVHYSISYFLETG